MVKVLSPSKVNLLLLRFFCTTLLFELGWCKSWMRQDIEPNKRWISRSSVAALYPEPVANVNNANSQLDVNNLQFSLFNWSVTLRVDKRTSWGTFASDLKCFPLDKWNTKKNIFPSSEFQHNEDKWNAEDKHSNNANFRGWQQSLIYS